MKRLFLAIALLLITASAFAQTRMAIVSGTALPSTCRVGELFYVTGSSTVYACDNTGTWNAVAGSGGGAPTTATYITQTPDATLSAEQALSGLATGLLKNTTGTGVLSIATAPTDYVATSDSRLSDARTPTAHATTHKSGGTDSIKLDEFAAPTDITTLNASTSAHGLLPKLPGGTTTFLRADGSFATPATQAHATTHESGGSDPIPLDLLSAPSDTTTLDASTSSHGLLPKLSGYTTQFLRGDGTYAAPTLPKLSSPVQYALPATTRVITGSIALPSPFKCNALRKTNCS